MTIKRKKYRQVAEINVVPYIDVMLVLLIIFMVTAPLLSQGVKVNLPEAAAKPLDSKPPEPIVVSVDAHGNYYLNVAQNPSQIITADALLERVSSMLQQSTPSNQRQVLVKGDKAVDYGSVISAMVILQRAGAENVGLVTDPVNFGSKKHR
jgi:biopolymer transport protein TolR